jgi:hypothetical protein
MGSGPFVMKFVHILKLTEFLYYYLVSCRLCIYQNVVNNWCMGVLAMVILVQEHR